MYTPKQNQENDPATLRTFMEAHSFATLVTVGEDGVPRATHLPFLIGGTGAVFHLYAHLARANAQWRDLADERVALVIFQGPHAYISPRQYERPLSVPTWDYVAVHARGAATLVDDEDRKLSLMAAMVRHYDPTYAAAHQALPETFLRGKLAATVAFEIAVSQLDARYKLSQDRSETERRSIVAALRESDDADARALASQITAKEPF